MDNLFHYKEINNQANKTLFTFHGTGGSEDDFLFLDGLLKQEWNIVGLRGNVDEQGMKRFFKRTSIGVFDIESIKAETEKLQQFITNWYTEKSISKEQCAFLGYSNGANILLALLFLYPDIVHKLLLLHPMLPFAPTYSFPHSSIQAFISIGENDQLIGMQESIALITAIKKLNVEVTEKIYSGGHEISHQEMNDVCEYLR